MNIERRFRSIRARWGWAYWLYRSLESGAGAVVMAYLWLVHHGRIEPSSPVWSEAAVEVFSAFGGHMWLFWGSLVWLPYWSLATARRAMREK